MFKKILDKAGFDALTTAQQEFYKVGADGKYHLQVEDDDTDALVNAKNHEKTKRQEAEAKAASLQKEKDDATEAARLAAEEVAKSSGDIAALEASWSEKLNTAVSAEKAKNKKLQAALTNSQVDVIAQQIANKISTVPSLLVDVIKKRLTTEITDDNIAITRVLDTAGKPSALSVADLEKEFVDNPEFAAIIKATIASGGGASTEQDEGGGGPGPKKLSDMNATEEAKFANSNPEEYERMLA